MTPDELLRLLADLKVARLHISQSGEIRGCCPCHADSNPSWAANPFTPGILCNCFACPDGKGPLLKIVAKVLGCSWRDARRYIERFGSYEEVAIADAPVVERQPYQKSTYAFYEDQCPSAYLLRRGIPERIQRACRIGVWENRVLIPWFDDSKRIIGIEERREDDRSWKGLFFPFERGDYLYAPLGVDSRSITLTEGALDVLRAYALGARSVVATGTAGMSERQEELIRRMAPQQIVLAYDHDVAGVAAAKHVFSRFADCSVVMLMPFPEGVKDLGEMRSSAMLSEAYGRSEVAAMYFTPKPKKEFASSRKYSYAKPSKRQGKKTASRFNSGRI